MPQMPQKNLYALDIMPSAQRKLYRTAATKLQSFASARQAKPRTTKLRSERVRGRQAYKNYVSSYTQENQQGLLGDKGFDLIFNFTPILKRELAQHKGLKIHLSALVRFYQNFSSEVLCEES